MNANDLENEGICVGCGMCCDGTMFNRARLGEGEGAKLAAEMRTNEEGGKTYFEQPCHFHQCGRCSIYEDRFNVCRSFSCKLLTSLQAGEVTENEARTKIETAFALRQAVTSSFPAAFVYKVRHALRGSLTKSLNDPATRNRERIGRQLVDIVALETFLDRWFRNEKVNLEE